MEEGCIPPLCDLLSSSDAKIVPVALDALDNILKVNFKFFLFHTVNSAYATAIQNACILQSLLKCC